MHKQWEHDLTVINLNTKQITKIVSDCTNSPNMKGSNITVTSVSTKQRLKVIWEWTHYRSMQGSSLIVNNVNTKQQKRQSKSAHYIETWRDQILLWSMWVQMCAQTIETWKHCTSKLLGFINNISTGTSNLIVINVSTKQNQKKSDSAHSIKTWGDQTLMWSMWVPRNTKEFSESAQKIKTWKHLTSRMLGFIKNQNMWTSNLIAINVSTKQRKNVIWQIIETWGDNIWLWSMWARR